MAIRYLTAGESHGPALVMIMEGLPAGIRIDRDQIDLELARRQRGFGAGPRMKIEQDRAEILSGVLAGETIGSPVAIKIINLNHERWKGKEIEPFTTPRPGHVDLAAAIKYGYEDLRPGLERSSARETAARVAAGAICKQLLENFQISIGGYVAAIGLVHAVLGEIPLDTRPTEAEKNDLRCPDPSAAEAMEAEIRAAIQSRDTLGGILEIIALGVPAGLGSHVQWDRRLEARLAAAVLSVQAIKGVEIGEAFANTRLPGTSAQDQIRLRGKELIRPTYRNGGIEGGISSGQPIFIRAAMKPIATTLTPQQSVDLATGEEVATNYERSDFCPVPRAVPILEAVIAIVLADALLEKLGGDSISEMLPRFKALKKARVSDLHMDGQSHLFWPDNT
ncbi:MAG: chorismate synthase [Anaerolineales bacterium]